MTKVKKKHMKKSELGYGYDPLTKQVLGARIFSGRIKKESIEINEFTCISSFVEILQTREKTISMQKQAEANVGGVGDFGFDVSASKESKTKSKRYRHTIEVELQKHSEAVKQTSSIPIDGSVLKCSMKDFLNSYGNQYVAKVIHGVQCSISFELEIADSEKESKLSTEFNIPAGISFLKFKEKLQAGFMNSQGITMEKFQVHFTGGNGDVIPDINNISQLIDVIEKFHKKYQSSETSENNNNPVIGKHEDNGIKTAVIRKYYKSYKKFLSEENYKALDDLLEKKEDCLESLDSKLNEINSCLEKINLYKENIDSLVISDKLKCLVEIEIHEVKLIAIKSKIDKYKIKVTEKCLDLTDKEIENIEEYGIQSITGRIYDIINSSAFEVNIERKTTKLDKERKFKSPSIPVEDLKRQGFKTLQLSYLKSNESQNQVDHQKPNLALMRKYNLGLFNITRKVRKIQADEEAKIPLSELDSKGDYFLRDTTKSKIRVRPV